MNTKNNVDDLTSEELFCIIEKMKTVSSDFYRAATQTDCHPFIEFCGLMNEYIKICENAAKKDIDFTKANAHSGYPLPMEVYEMHYISEKLNCIFGPSIRNNEEVKEAFYKAFE